MLTSTVTSKGQTTIPVEIRKLLNIKSGDKITFSIDDNGRIMLRAKNLPISALKGIIKSPSGKVPTAEEIDEAVSEHLAEKYKPQ